MVWKKTQQLHSHSQIPTLAHTYYDVYKKEKQHPFVCFCLYVRLHTVYTVCTQYMFFCILIRDDSPGLDFLLLVENLC